MKEDCFSYPLSLFWYIRLFLSVLCMPWVLVFFFLYHVDAQRVRTAIPSSLFGTYSYI